MRGDARARGPILVRKVDKQGRLQLGSDIQEYIPWLQRGQDYIASVGPAGGLRIEPRQDVESREAELPVAPLEEEDVDSPIADYRRYTSFRWNIRIEKSRWNFTLPEEVRKLGLAPNKREQAILFADGVLFEVWRKESWLQFLRSIARNRTQALETALDEA